MLLDRVLLENNEHGMKPVYNTLRTAIFEKLCSCSNLHTDKKLIKWILFYNKKGKYRRKHV